MRIKESGNTIVAYLEGDLDAAQSPILYRELEGLAQKYPNKHLIVNLESVEYVSSSGIGLFVAVSRLLQKSNRSLALCKLSASVKRVFELVGMLNQVPIHESEEDAIAAVPKL